MSGCRVTVIVRRALLTIVATGLIAIAAASVLAQESDLAALDGEIVADGSSTLRPLTQAVAERFNERAPGVQISVGLSGTGGGFERFCAGETDLQNASRPIARDEIAACAEHGIAWYELDVAYDGIIIVVNKENTLLTCLTTSALRQIWKRENPAKTWADLSSELPAETISLYGPGPDSGTFDYFVEQILGADGIRDDFTPSEDDNVLVEGIAGDVNALGYVGGVYYQENQEILTALAIDNGNGNCVLPTPETIEDRSYNPLTRPLSIYVRADALERPEVREFIRFYLREAPTLAPEIGYVAAPDEVYAADLETLENATAGSATPEGVPVATPVR